MIYNIKIIYTNMCLYVYTTQFLQLVCEFCGKSRRYTRKILLCNCAMNFKERREGSNLFKYRKY